jgi:hypothetical protein
VQCVSSCKQQQATSLSSSSSDNGTAVVHACTCSLGGQQSAMQPVARAIMTCSPLCP